MDPPFSPSVDRVNRLSIASTARKRVANPSPQFEQLKRARASIQDGMLRQVEIRNALFNDPNLTPEEKEDLQGQLWNASQKKEQKNLLEEFEKVASLGNTVLSSATPLANKIKLKAIESVQSMDADDHTAMYKWCKRWDETLSALFEVDTSTKIDITKSKLPRSMHTDFDTAFSKYEYCWVLEHKPSSVEEAHEYEGLYCGTHETDGSELVVNWLTVLSSMLRIVFERLPISIFTEKLESHVFLPGTSIENHIVEFGYLLKSLELAQGGILPRQQIRYFLSGLPQIWLHSAGESDWSDLGSAYTWARNKSKTATMVADLHHDKSRGGGSQINSINGSTVLFPTEQTLTNTKVISKRWQTAEPKQLKNALANKQALQQFVAGLGKSGNSSKEDVEDNSGDETDSRKNFTTASQINALTTSVDLQKSMIADLLCHLEKINARPVSCSFCPYRNCFQDGIRKNNWRELKDDSEPFSHKSHECPELKKHPSAKKGWCGRCTNFGHSYFDCPHGLGARKPQGARRLNEERGGRYQRG